MAEDGNYGGGSGFNGFEGGVGRKSGKRKVGIIVAIIFLVVASVAAALYVLRGGGPLLEVISSISSDNSDATDEAVSSEEGDIGDAPIFFDVPEMLVNLSTAGRQRVYLKIKVALELENQGDVAVVERLMPRVIDNFQIYLRELRIEDLNGSAGMYRLQEELMARVNAAVAPAKVKSVLFKEMLVQ